MFSHHCENGVFFFNYNARAVELQKFDGFNVVGYRHEIDDALRRVLKSIKIKEKLPFYSYAEDSLYLFVKKGNISFIKWDDGTDSPKAGLVDIHCGVGLNNPKNRSSPTQTFLSMCLKRNMTPEEILELANKSYLFFSNIHLCSLTYFSYDELFDGVDENKAKEYFGDLMI